MQRALRLRHALVRLDVWLVVAWLFGRLAVALHVGGRRQLAVGLDVGRKVTFALVAWIFGHLAVALNVWGRRKLAMRLDVWGGRKLAVALDIRGRGLTTLALLVAGWSAALLILHFVLLSLLR